MVYFECDECALDPNTWVGLSRSESGRAGKAETKTRGGGPNRLVSGVHFGTWFRLITITMPQPLREAGALDPGTWEF